MTLSGFRVVVSGGTIQNIGSENSSRSSIRIQNLGSSTIFIAGSENLSASGGFPILQSDVFTDQVYYGHWYAVCSGTENSTVSILEEEY